MKGMVSHLIAWALLFSFASSGVASDIRFLGMHTFEPGVNIRDVTHHDRNYYAVDSGNSCLYEMSVSNGSLLVEATFYSLGDPRAIAWLPGWNRLLVSDRNYQGERSLLILEGGEFSRVSGYTGSPDRFFSGAGGCYALRIIIPSGEETEYGYRIEKLTLSNQDGEVICRIDSEWYPMPNRDIFSFLTSYPRVVVIGSNVALTLLLEPSSTLYGDFSVLESSDPDVYHDQWGLNPLGSWGDTIPRTEAELENLRELVAIDPYFEWNLETLPQDYRCRRIISELGVDQSKLLVLRTSGEYPVIDVFDLADRSVRLDPNPREMDDHSKSVFPPQEALEGYWQYRIADRRLIAFNRNTIYVFEIKSL